jgi:hypothetical protein
LIEDIILTITACNRPALVIFIDFLSAFDKMWYPALVSSLIKLEMPLHLLKWITSWLKGRTLFIHHGDAFSRKIKMFVGAPQGSILAATLFRLHIHFLPSIFKQITTHLFADDLALLMVGSLEKKFSINIKDLEIRAKQAMIVLEKFADDMILPVNVPKTKALLIHNIVSPTLPTVEYKNQKIEFVSNFKYLGVSIACKLGWGNYISNIINKMRKINNAMKILYHNLPKKNINIRRKIFLSCALPHFIWLFPTWFYFTEKQKEKIFTLFCSGIRLVYSLKVGMGDSGSESESESESESAIPTPIPMLNMLKYTDSGTILKMIQPIPIRFRLQLTKKLESVHFHKKKQFFFLCFLTKI